MGASETKETIVRNKDKEEEEEEERVNCVDEEEHLDISIEKQLDSIKTLSISTKREESSDFETDVIIVGAGISGIKAAKSLSEKGIKVILLEANTRFGGRIWTSDFFSSDKKVNIDLGASFIHGAHNNPLYRLANELKLQIIGTGIFSDMFSADGTNMSLNEVLSKLNYNKAQKAVNISEIYQEIIGNVEKLYLKMAKEGKGEQYTTSLKYAWEQVIAKKKLNKSFFDSKKIEFQMLNFLLSGLEQYEAAPWEELSLGFYEEEELPGGDSCIKEGYGEILTHLVKNLDIRLEHEVDSILYSENSVQVSCKNGKKFQSQKCIITLPVGILQKDIVKFEPPLPSWKIESINKMGMGLMNKVVLQFESCFWKKSLYTICYASETRGKFRWFFNQYPTTESPILVGFLTTKIAHEMEEITDEEIISQALSVLDKMYPGKVTKLIKSFVTRWGKNPYSFGSYSFCKLGATPEHFKNLFKPVQDTLFFAGEHTAREYIGTVHGAYLSGIRAAINVCNSFK